MAGQNKHMDRRDFVKLAGASALAVPLAGLTACGDKPATPSVPAADTKPAIKPAEKPAAQVNTTAADTKPAMVATGDMPKMEESDPLAQSLGYKHNVADIDLDKYPQRGTPAAANNYCYNCVLYTGADGAEWGGCSIFGGKQVNAQGWCATYAPKG